MSPADYLQIAYGALEGMIRSEFGRVLLLLPFIDLLVVCAYVIDRRRLRDRDRGRVDDHTG